MREASAAASASHCEANARMAVKEAETRESVLTRGKQHLISNYALASASAAAESGSVDQ